MGLVRSKLLIMGQTACSCLHKAYVIGASTLTLYLWLYVGIVPLSVYVPLNAYPNFQQMPLLSVPVSSTYTNILRGIKKNREINERLIE